jgi:hypothetical protein
MNLDYLIPSEILTLISDQEITVELTLQGSPCQDRWPRAQLLVDNTVVFDDLIKENTVITHKGFTSGEGCKMSLIYLDKTDVDTIVDENGTIEQNQRIEIVKWVINNMDIVKNNVIHSGIGCYTPNLSPEKYKYFIEHNHSVLPTTSLDMAENGEWNLDIKTPVSAFLLDKLHGEIPLHQQFDLESIIVDVYETALVCENLTKIKEHQNNKK